MDVEAGNFAGEDEEDEDEGAGTEGVVLGLLSTKQVEIVPETPMLLHLSKGPA